MAALTTAIIIGVSALVGGIVGSVGTPDRPTQSKAPSQRRTREDYLNTSFYSSPNLKTNNSPLTPLTALTPQIQPPTPVTPLTALEPYTVGPEPLTPSTYNKIAGWNPNAGQVYNYYNDPYQVNSLADVALNNEAQRLVAREYGAEWLSDIPDWIPVLGWGDELLAGVDLLKRDVIEPITQRGDWGEVLMNALHGTGETLDIVANPVKGLFMEGPEGVVRGLGVGSEGRTNYNYDIQTGNETADFWLTLGAEILSDPLNLATFGGKAALSSSVKATTKTVIKETGEEIAQETAEQFAKQLGKEVSYDAVFKGTRITDSLNKVGNSYETLLRNGVSADVATRIQKEVYNAYATQSTKRILQGVSTIANTANKVDDVLLMSTPVGWGFKAAGAGFKAVANATTNNVIRKAQQYVRPSNSLDGATVIDPSIFESDTLLKAVADEQKITNLLGTRPSIDYLPTDETLLKVYQEYSLKNGKLDMGDFIDALVDNKLITPEQKVFLEVDDAFIKYYSDSIMPQGKAMQELNTVLTTDNGLLRTNVKKVLSEESNKASQIIKLQEVYKDLLNTTETLTLQGYREELVRLITKYQSDLMNAGSDVSKKLLSEQAIKHYQTLLQIFDSSTLELGLDALEAIPETVVLRGIKEQPDLFKSTPLQQYTQKELKNVYVSKQETTAQSIQKLRAVERNTEYYNLGNEITDAELPEITEDNLLYKYVQGTLERLGLHNAQTVSVIKNSVVDATTQLSLLKELASQNLKDPANTYDILDILYELGESQINKFDFIVTSKLYNQAGDSMYWFKLNQTASLSEVLEAFNTDPVAKATLFDIANGTTNTKTGMLFSMLENVDVNNNIFDVSMVTRIREDAQSLLNYEKLFNMLADSSYTDGNMNFALLDLISGYNYKDMKTFMERFSRDGNTITKARVYRELERAVNPLKYQKGFRTNAGTHEVLGLGAVDEATLHNARVDIDNVLHENLEEFIRREQVKFKDGEVFVEFDIETTGLDMDGTNQVLQIYAHKYQYTPEGLKDLGSLEHFIKYNEEWSIEKLSNEVKNVLGPDTLRAVQQSDLLEVDALHSFRNFVGNDTLVSHNGNAFDIPFLSKRLGFDLDNKSVDLLDVMNKTYPDVKIPKKAVDSFTTIIQDFVDTQRLINPNHVIKTIDKETVDNFATMLDNVISKTGLALPDGSINQNSLEQLISNSLDNNFFSELQPALANIKIENTMANSYYITGSALKEKVGKNTNIFAYLNGHSDVLENGFVPNRYGAKQLHPNKLVKKFLDLQASIDAGDELASAYSTLLNKNLDFVEHIKAVEQIASTGDNTSQAARIFYIDKLLSNTATAKENLSALSNKILARNYDTAFEQASEVQEYILELTSLANADTKRYSYMTSVLETQSILKSSPDNLAKFMYHEAPRIRVGNITHEGYSELIDTILKNKRQYRDYGIIVRKREDSIYLDLIDDVNYFETKYKNNVDYGFEKFTLKPSKNKKYQSMIDRYTKEFDKTNAMRKNKIPFTAQGTASNNMYADQWREMYERSTKSLPGSNTLANNREYMTSFFKTSDPKRSYINLGDIDTRRAFNQYQQDPFKGMITDMEQRLSRSDGRNKFIELNFNKDLTLDGELYKDLSDEDIATILQEGGDDYVVAILEAGNDGLGNVRFISPRNASQVKLLRNQGFDAIIAPRFHANKIAKTINNRVGEQVFKNPIVQFYQKYILSTYQSLYLTSVGLLARNFGDIIVKNSNGYGIDGVFDSQLSFMKAWQDWKAYDDTVKEIIEFSKAPTFNKASIDNYFRLGNAKITRETFDEIHDYATSNVSAGMAEAQQQLLSDYYVKEQASKFDQVFFDNPLRKYTTDVIMDQNTHIEHAGRLSGLRIAKANGLNDIDAYNKVLRTHFDYGTKSKAMATAQLIIPFVTYTVYNLKYWIDAAFENVWLVELLTDATRTSLELENQTQFMLDNSMKLESALSNGNVVIGDTQWKINPSLSDAINLSINPLGALEQRLVAPVKAGTEALGRSATGEEKYESTTVSNLDRIGLGDAEDILSDAGLYNIARAGNTILKVLAPLDPTGQLEGVDHAADVVPSLLSEFERGAYGTQLGEGYQTTKVNLAGGTRYDTRQSTTGIVTKSTFYPTKYPNTSYTAGRSYNRIPYARRYYSGSYNWYNNWKANRASLYATTTPSVESLSYTFKGLLYDIGMSPRMLRAYDRKQNQVYRV